VTTAEPAAADVAAWTAEWGRWRSVRERNLRDPHGWLSLVGLRWLGPEWAAVAGLPGRWSADASGVAVRAEPADGLLLDGVAIDGTVRVEPADGAPGPRVVADALDVEVELIRRGPRFAARVRDPASPTLARFAGVPTFPPSVDWVLIGHFAPYAGGRPVTVGSVVDGLTHALTARGVIRFDREGTSLALTAFGSGDTLRVPFRDATNGVSTHGAGRSLDVTGPDADGRVGLDFNRATNLPCAFTDHATCPLPPPENTLPFAVEAGEQTPR
jgi:uncharacterized protein (DUF1684 family)